MQFPPNVKILPEKYLERKRQQDINAIKSRQTKIERQKKEEELLKSIRKRRLETRISMEKLTRREKRRLRLQEERRLAEEKAKEENYGQFYGRPR